MAISFSSFATKIIGLFSNEKIIYSSWFDFPIIVLFTIFLMQSFTLANGVVTLTPGSGAIGDITSVQLEVGDIYDAGGINKRDIYAITIFTTNDGQTVMNNPGYSSGQSTPDFPESPNAGEQPSWANSRCHSTWALSEENCGFDAFDDAGNYLTMDWMSMGPWDLQSDSMIGMDFIIDFMGADGYAFACCSELYALSLIHI